MRLSSWRNQRRYVRVFFFFSVHEPHMTPKGTIMTQLAILRFLLAWTDAIMGLRVDVPVPLMQATPA